MQVGEGAALNSQVTDALQIYNYDYIELYVGNAHQAAHFYCARFGFKPTAYFGLETGGEAHVSIMLKQHDVRLLLTSAIVPESQIAEHVKLHGDGVKDIAFAVQDSERAFEEAVCRGARPVLEPIRLQDEKGSVVKSTIACCGDIAHSFIQRDDYRGLFLPGFRAVESPVTPLRANISAVDHIAVSVNDGQLETLVDFYVRVLGFRLSHQEMVATEYSSMNSMVVESNKGNIKFPIIEPAQGKRKSQVEEYLKFHCGPGVQHIALLSHDIIETVKALRAGGSEFLHIPGAYYDLLEGRVGEIEEDTRILQEQNILVDRDRWGYLMQIFTKPVQSRPTLFMEVIQRKGALGFGSGNIRALFEAVEREQALRGNL